MTQEEFAFCCNACKNLNSPIGMACDFCENASNFESKDNMPLKPVKTRNITELQKPRIQRILREVKEELLRYCGTTRPNTTAPTRSLSMNYSFDNVMNTDITKELAWLKQYDAERNNAMNKAINKICNVPNEYKLYIDDFTSRTIKNVIFNDPATIVFWTDGTKTVVKAKNEEFDPEKGLAMAIAKKFLGNKGSYYNEFKKWIK